MLELLSTLILLYIAAIVLMIVFSWFPQQPGSALYSLTVFLRRITDPVFAPIRRVIPPIGGMIDLTPMIVIVGLQILRGLLLS